MRRHPSIFTTAVILLLSEFLRRHPVQSFATVQLQGHEVRRVVSLSDTPRSPGDEDDFDDLDHDFMPSMTPEKSRMTDFIADFLKKSGQSDDRNAQGVSTPQAASEADTITNIDPDSFTHLIAMPVDKCH